MTLAYLVLISAIFISIPSLRVRGLMQRIAECALFGSLCVLV